MRRLLLACVALLLVGAGCDAVGSSDWAARIDGDEISMAEVQAAMELAAAQPTEGEATTTTTPFQLPGTTTRQVLGFLVSGRLAEQTIEELDADGRIADEQQDLYTELVRSYEEQFETIISSEEERASIAGAFAATAALTGMPADQNSGSQGFDGILASMSDDDLAGLLDGFYAATPEYWSDWVCLEALVIPTSDRAAVDARLGSPDASLEQAADVPGAQLLFDSVSSCLPASELSPALTEVLEASPEGEITTREEAGQDGTPYTFYFRPLGSKDVERDDPIVAAEFRRDLSGTGGQRALTALLGAAAREADIEILSTIGSGFDDETLSVTAPATPLGATTTTLPLLGG